MDKKRILIGFEMMRSGDMRGSRLVQQKTGQINTGSRDIN